MPSGICPVIRVLRANCRSVGRTSSVFLFCGQISDVEDIGTSKKCKFCCRMLKVENVGSAESLAIYLLFTLFCLGESYSIPSQ